MCVCVCSINPLCIDIFFPNRTRYSICNPLSIQNAPNTQNTTHIHNP